MHELPGVCKLNDEWTCTEHVPFPRLHLHAYLQAKRMPNAHFRLKATASRTPHLQLYDIIGPTLRVFCRNNLAVHVHDNERNQVTCVTATADNHSIALMEPSEAIEFMHT